MNLFLPRPPVASKESQDSTAAVSVMELQSRMAITKRKIRKLDAIARAPHSEGHRTQRVSSARPFVLCGTQVRIISCRKQVAPSVRRISGRSNP
jgi:hypothetical protein